MRASWGSPAKRVLREAEWNSSLNVDKRDNHDGFALVDGRYSRVNCLRRVARVSKCLSNQASSARWVGKTGEGGMELSLRRGSREGQSVLHQLGLSRGGDQIGWEKRIVISLWSEPVEGSGESHDLKKGAREGDAKARSRTEGLSTPARENRVYTPGVLSMLKPRSAAREK